MTSPLTRLSQFFAGWVFAAWLLGLMLAWQLWLLAMLVLPDGDGALAAFAAEFRAWCFGSDPATGAADGIQAFAMITSPLIMAALVFGLWGGLLRGAWRHTRRRLLGHAGAGVAAAAACAVLLVATAELPLRGPLPFPATALRTEVPAPPLRLVDHTGAEFDLAAERGRVVLVAAVYSSCGYACPGLMADVAAVLAALSPAERADLRVLLPTLDPERDTVGVLATVARARQFQAPAVRMLTGPPAAVERGLDRFGFERRRDPVTGVIDHPPLFVLVDRAGRVAYRLAPSPSQQDWLLAAVRTLLAEAPGS